MPKKGIAKCDTCNREFGGIFPDHEKPGYRYMSLDDEIDKGTVKSLQGHHSATAENAGFRGTWGGTETLMYF